MPNPIAIDFFGFEIRWYGILIATAMILSTIIVYVRAPKHNIDREYILDILIIAVPIGIIGARLYYVLFEWSYYKENLDQIINTRGGGLAIHGGLIFGLTVAGIMCKKKDIKVLNLFDLAVPAIALAQSIGRWGNYFNSEAHGGITDLPWGIIVNGEKVHPTFLYESIWCLGLFLFLIFMDNRPHFQGKITCLYGILYSVERFFVEALRTDSLMIGPFKQAQLISLVTIVICTMLYVVLKKREKEL